jgi:type I restriction enzyme, S subunit
LKDCNENRPGYKKTKVGWIPKEWNEKQFRALYISGPQNGLYKKQDAYGEGCRMVHMPHLFANNYISDQEMPRVRLTEHEKNNYLLKNGDLLFGRRSLAVEGAGKC